MKRTAVFYGSSTGTTQMVAKQIAYILGADVYDVADKPVSKIQEYDNLILGTSTWGVGDLQDDWEAFLPDFKKNSLAGKAVAIFGLGNAEVYSDSFVDGMRMLFDTVKGSGATVVGFCPSDNYTFDHSEAVIDGEFVGLALDDENQSDLTNTRITAWVDQIKGKLN
ncbi:MAG: flavodoxin [Bacteroidales bacterium]|nr:flavodoxin [Bacteroidales bacterium]